VTKDKAVSDYSELTGGRRSSTRLLVVALFVVMGIVATGCSTNPGTTGGSSATTVASPSNPPPDRCESGSVWVSAPTTKSVCVVEGAHLKVTFVKPRKTAIGVAGPWNVPPIGISSPPESPRVITTTATSIRRRTVTVQFRAREPGTATAYATFGQACAGPDQTGCTIPPSVPLTLTVVVVAR
jgi:hypothetical protein